MYIHTSKSITASDLVRIKLWRLVNVTRLDTAYLWTILINFGIQV